MVKAYSDGVCGVQSDGSWCYIETQDAEWHTYSVVVNSGEYETLSAYYFLYNKAVSAYIDDITIEKLGTVTTNINGDTDTDICDLVRLYNNLISDRANPLNDLNKDGKLDGDDLAFLRKELLGLN